MNRQQNTAGLRRVGASANRVLLPIILVLALLHAAIIGLILGINETTSSLSSTMQLSGQYTSDANGLLAGASLMSETSTGFVLAPYLNGGLNTEPLGAYAAELARDRRGDAVAARFETYYVTDEVRALIDEAAAAANAMMEVQLHAIALVTSVYQMPSAEPFASLPLPALTQEEAALDARQRIDYARELILSTENYENKHVVSQNVNAASGMIQSAAGQIAAEYSRRTAMLRRALWAVTLTIIALLAVTFIILYRSLITPLIGFGRLINCDSSLDECRGLREVRQLATAYNGLMRRRDALDGILRDAAQTDTLTNLPNRYGFEQYLLESGDSGYSLAIVLFDVNYLKNTNDTQGHAAGDVLLRKSAQCISDCFGAPEEKNCFRFGGDEFAAVVKDVDPDTVAQLVEAFLAEQQRRGISVSCGYAYTEDIGSTTIRTLMDMADERMYAQKKQVHELPGGAENYGAPEDGE